MLNCCGSYFVESVCVVLFVVFFCFQAEDGIRDLVRSRGLGDVYKRQEISHVLDLGLIPMEYSKLIAARYSVRAYRPDPVEDEKLQAVLDLSLIHI